MPAVATAPEDDVVAAPCSIHDDRLRELETEQAAQHAQLVAGADMFRAVQDSIRTLSEGVRDSMNRVERAVGEVSSDVKSLSSKVAEIQVQQGRHEERLKAISDQHEEERVAKGVAEEARRERRKFYRDWGLRIGVPLITMILAASAASHGKSVLAAILRAIGAGG